MLPALRAHTAHTAPIATPHPIPHKAPRRSQSRQAAVTLLPRTAEPTPTPLTVASEPERRRAQPYILIVEDDPCTAHAIQDTLRLEGEPDWTIQVAEGGERALALAAERPPNVVLLDVGLPDLDGAEVYRRLRAYPQTSAAHVLFLTAATSLDLHQRGVDAGVVLRKPFEMRELVGLVRTFVAS
jgi:CheY-like chemotaxis protein